MDHLFKEVALRCGLSLSQYWHLQLVLSVSLVPLLAVGYWALFDRRRGVKVAHYTLWVNREGRLVARRRQ